MSTGSMRRAFALSGLLALGVGNTASAQQHQWVVDSKASLAWWQMNPTLGHLWATTCPDEPSWRAGEGSTIDQIGHVIAKRAEVTNRDEKRIPLYPRRTVRSLCSPALSGSVFVGDTARGNTMRAALKLSASELVTGNEFRDNYGRKAIFDIAQFPDILIRIDSLIQVKPGEATTSAIAVGSWEFRGVRAPFHAPIMIEPQTGGALRVQGKFAIPASELTEKYGVSTYALGLSVGLRVWRTLNMGLDLLLRPQGSPTQAGGAS
jgi:hypothetical protein